MGKRRKIILITATGFPYGEASSKRNFHLIKTLIEADYEAEVFVVAETEDKNKALNKMAGVFDQVKYRYLTLTNIRTKLYFLKLISYSFGLINLFISICIQAKKYRLIIISDTFTRSVLYNNLFSKFMGFLNIKYLLAKDEYPLVVRRPSSFSEKYRNSFLKNYFRYFDGVIVITKTLENYYRVLTNPVCKFFHFPMTVDIDLFTNAPKKRFGFEYILYGGFEFPDFDKDGVHILVEAWASICSRFPDTKLLLAGKFPEKRYQQVKDLNLEDRVVFSGLIHPEKMPAYIKGARVLALARPANKQAEGGFSTKLGEYLASGVPVVVTKVGEFGNYLSDKKNAFLAKPGDANDFGEKMVEALNNHSYATEIGTNGAKLARNTFYFKNYISQFKNYIESL